MKNYIKMQHINENYAFFRHIEAAKKALTFLFALFCFATLVAVKSNAQEMTTAQAKASLELVNEINELRANNGLKPLLVDETLNAVAEVRAEEISTKWSHTRPNGKQGYTLIKGNVWKGENLSYATGTPEETVDIMFNALCDSPTHLDNMLFNEFTRIGISTYETNGTTYVAYMFAS